MFTPAWSLLIHEQWIRNVRRQLGIPLKALAYRRERMDLAFSEALHQPLSSWVSEVLAGCRTEGQRKDAHVIALAITTKANPVITDSERDFLRKLLDSRGRAAIPPDAFCIDMILTQPVEVLAPRSHHRSLRRPPVTAHQYLDHLAGSKIAPPKLAGHIKVETLEQAPLPLGVSRVPARIALSCKAYSHPRSGGPRPPPARLAPAQLAGWDPGSWIWAAGALTATIRRPAGIATSCPTGHAPIFQHASAILDRLDLPGV